jgi:hypothetical protein
MSFILTDELKLHAAGGEDGALSGGTGARGPEIEPLPLLPTGDRKQGLARL